MHLETVGIYEDILELFLAVSVYFSPRSEMRKATRKRLESLLDNLNDLIFKYNTADLDIVQQMFDRVAPRYRTEIGTKDPESIRIQMKLRLIIYVVERTVRIGPHRPSILYSMNVDGPLRRLQEEYLALLELYGDFMNSRRRLPVHGRLLHSKMLDQHRYGD